MNGYFIQRLFALGLIAGTLSGRADRKSDALKAANPVSPNGKYEVVFKPLPGDEAWTSQVVILNPKTKKVLFSETFTPYFLHSPNPQAWAAWNTSSSLVAVTMKVMKWGHNWEFYTVAGDKVQRIPPSKGDLEEARQYEYSDKSSAFPVGWVSANDFLVAYHDIRRLKTSEEWDRQESEGYRSYRFVENGESSYTCIRLDKSPEPAHRFAAADYELNQVYKDIIALEDVPLASKEALKKSQRAWISFKDADAQLFEIASGRNKYEMLEELTKKRVNTLKEMLSD